MSYTTSTLWICNQNNVSSCSAKIEIQPNGSIKIGKYEHNHK